MNMKKLFVILGITIVFFALNTQMIHATTITFDEPGLVSGYGPFGTPAGSEITNQFAALGVLFSIDANGAEWVSSADGSTGNNVLSVQTIPPLGTATTLTATFIDPAGSGSPATVEASSFSVFVSDTDPSPSPRVIVRTFGLDGNLLEEKGLTNSGSTLDFSVGQIARVEFFDNGGDGHLLDDFSFGTVSPAPVPVPPSFLLLGFGLLGLAGWGQFRKS